MIAVDTNVLVYAHREEFPRHADALGQVTRLAEGTAPWGIPIFCFGEFVRVVTHRKILTPPSSIEQAVAFLDAVSTSDSFRLLLPDASYWSDLRSLALAAQATGNLLFEAQIAAVCISHGAVLLTHDRDFARLGLATVPL